MTVDTGPNATIIQGVVLLGPSKVGTVSMDRRAPVLESETKRNPYTERAFCTFCSNGSVVKMV